MALRNFEQKIIWMSNFDENTIPKKIKILLSGRVFNNLFFNRQALKYRIPFHCVFFSFSIPLNPRFPWKKFFTNYYSFLYIDISFHMWSLPSFFKFLLIFPFIGTWVSNYFIINYFQIFWGKRGSKKSLRCLFWPQL